MQETFSLEDIFKVMIELEDLGNKHYLEMQLLTSDYELKELFGLLAKQENTHKKVYTTYKNSNIVLKANKADREYQAYINSLLKGTIRFLNASREIKDFDHGLDIAVNLEKDTILFLSELKTIIDSNYYEAIDNILDQERSHLKSLYLYIEKSK